MPRIRTFLLAAAVLFAAACDAAPTAAPDAPAFSEGSTAPTDTTATTTTTCDTCVDGGGVGSTGG